MQKECKESGCRKLVVPGDLRSYGGGNGLPRAVKQSPNFSRIAEVEEEDEDEEEQNKNDMTTILVRFFISFSTFSSLPSLAISYINTVSHSIFKE